MGDANLLDVVQYSLAPRAAEDASWDILRRRIIDQGNPIFTIVHAEK